MRKFHEEVVLLEQPFVIDPDLKVKDAIDRLAEKLGSSIVVTGFVRFALGEGLAPKTVEPGRRGRRSWPAPEVRAVRGCGSRRRVAAALNVDLTAPA